MFCENFDLTNIVTPIRIQRFTEMLKQAGYDQNKIDYLDNGFRQGFDIGYRGPTSRKSNSKNIPLKMGSQTELWNKIMKEVELKRVAGPYTSVPFDNYIQSPVGLVPKDGGKKTHLIFHLSFDFDKHDDQEFKSLNYFTPKELSSVRYNDLDCTVSNMLSLAHESERIIQEMGNTKDNGMKGGNNCSTVPIYSGKMDVQSAFRLVPLSKWSWQWLIIKVQHPISGEWRYFVDKCLPFGVSISCVIFQSFSDALKFLAEYRTRAPKSITNYLDDFLFIAKTIMRCTFLMQEFLKLCEEVGVPISLAKTEWPALQIIFLGILLDGSTLMLTLP